MIKLEILDGTTPMLEKIAELSYGMALESLSVAGSLVQRESRKSLLSQSHNWHHYYKDGKHIIFKDTASARKLGARMSSSGGRASPNSMANFITSYLMKKNLTVVVGGRHPSFTPEVRKDGVVTGRLPRVSATSKGTQAILTKLDQGVENEHYDRATLARFKGAQYVARNFMDKGVSASKSGVLEALTSRYESLLHKAVERANVKIVRRKIA